ncbi:MAG TPA: tetratricopeptide repeat protein, partial [Geobacteraceae bacterium]
QRFASLAAMLYLLSLILYAAARLGQVRAGRLWSPGTGLLLAASLAAALLACSTKENAFTLPFALFLYEGMFFPLTRRKKAFLVTAAVAGAAAAGGVALWYGSSLGKLLSDVGGSLSAARDISRWHYLLTQFEVIATYVRLIFFPFRQNLDYAYPLAGSFFGPTVLRSLALLLGLQALAGLAIVRTERGGDGGLRLVAFGIFWFFLALAVESSVIPIADVIFEHRLYLPSIGAFMALAALLFLVPPPAERIARAAFAAVIVLLMVVTWQRNEVWRDGVTLWEDVIAKSPGKARPRNELGKVLFEVGRYPEAIASYQAAIGLDRDFFPAHNNLGAAYFKSGNLDGAMAEYLVAVRLQPRQAEVHNNLGVIYDRKGLFDRARAEFETALQLRADYSAAYDNLGSVLRKTGRMEEAIARHLTALRLQPGFASAYNNLGIAYAEEGRLDEAVDCFGKAVGLEPRAAEFHHNLAEAYDLKGWHERAAAERRVVGERATGE